MKKTIFYLPLLILFFGCSSEPLQNEVNFEALNLETEVQFPGMELSGVVTWDLINDQNGKSKGRVYIGNDCDNLYVLIEGADEGNLELINEGEPFPAKNGKKENVTPDREYYLNELPLMWTFDLNSFDPEGINVFVNAGGHSWGGDLTWGNAKYFYYEFQVNECAEICTYGKGWWRNHSNDNSGEQEDFWPVNELTLGQKTYNQAALNEIMDVPNKEGNNLVIFSQHLIAAKLNVANGAGNEAIVATIAEADELIGTREVLVDSFPAEWKSEVNDIKEILEAYNESSPCEEEGSEE